MHLHRILYALLPALLPLSSASEQPHPYPPPDSPPARLWATHYNGHVYTLEFDGHRLSLTDTLKTCGAMPSWLTFDAQARVLYCADESGTADPSTHGSLTAYSVLPDGKLEALAETETIGGGVHSVVYEAEAGGKFLAIAH